MQRLRRTQRIQGLRTSKRIAKPKALPLSTEPRKPTPQERLALRGIIATDLEALVFLWLEGQGYREGVDFSFQSGLFGGRQEAGGQVADFILYTGRAYPLVIRVMGEYWHESPEAQGKDDGGKSLLIAQGFEVVDVWGQDILTSLNFTMEQALRGIELR